MPPSERRDADLGSISLARYIEIVNHCARERLSYPIANGSAIHARILISKLFEIAAGDVRLITGTLREKTSQGIEIYGHEPVISRAKEFLQRPNTRLSILIQTGIVDRGERNRFIESVVGDPARKGTVVFYVPRREVLGSEVPHFMVSDSSVYRLETGEEANPANTEYTAVANFGDVDLARSLSDYFSDVTNYVEEEERLSQRLELQPGEVPHFSAP
jgi:hypothetical protein